MTNYSTARYWAISGIGYGKGFTPEEAVNNYVTSQMRNFRAADTAFKTRAKFKAALGLGGEAGPSVFMAPEGYDGFVIGMGSHWTSETEGVADREFSIEDRVYTFGGAFTCTVKVGVNDEEQVVTLLADGKDEVDALANAEHAVSVVHPYAFVSGVSVR